MLTIITVNFNGAADTLALLRSLELQTDRMFDVILVDNDSEPNDRQTLASYATTSPLNLELVYSDRNRGFSGGCNLGIRKAIAQRADWVLLLNNDTTVSPAFIATIHAQLPITPAVIGIPLDEGAHTAYAGHVRWLASTLSHFHTYPVLETQAYAIGGGVLIHHSVFERVGLLDERFFLYFEDAEFSLRARRAGIQRAWWSEPAARHRVSASTARLGSPLLLRYHSRNALLFNSVHGPWWVRAVLPVWSIISMVKQGIKIVSMPTRRPQSRAIALGIIDFYANRFGKIDDRRY